LWSEITSEEKKRKKKEKKKKAQSPTKLISKDKIFLKKFKKKCERKKLESTQVHSTNPSPSTWDCDKKFFLKK